MVKLFSENLKLLCDANYCKLFEEWRWRWITTPNDDNDVEAVCDVDPACGSLIIDHYPIIYHHLPSVGGQNHVVGMVKQCSFWNIVMFISLTVAADFVPSSFWGDGNPITPDSTRKDVESMTCHELLMLLRQWTHEVGLVRRNSNQQLRNAGVGRKMLSPKAEHKFHRMLFFQLPKAYGWWDFTPCG